MKKYIFLLLVSFQGLLAQVQFEAKVSKQTLGLNERLRIDFSMNDDGDNFVPPNFDGFKVIAGPSQQVSQSWINGRSSFNKTYSYFLLPTQKGSLVIRQASIEINGQIYKTSPIRINVTAAVEQPRDPNDTQVSADDAIHLVAEVSKTSPYINEPITVVYKLYFSYNIGISNWRELDKPKYNDFWSQNIDIKQLVAEEGKYNGERYRYVVLRKTVLYPQKSGRLVIEPLSLDIDVQVPTNRRTVFGQMVLQEGNKRVSAGSKTINVKALPEAGKPEDFSGAVGKFDFKVTPSKTNLKSGESLDLDVAIIGKGNLKLFTLPKPVVPSALEMYDPVHNEQVNTPLTGMVGKIADKYTIIPQYKGKYPIKPMQFSYFDLNTGTYKTITSPEIMVNVMEGPTASGNEVTENTGVNKREILSSAQFKYIMLKTNLKAMKQKDFFGSPWFYSLTILPFLCIPFIVLFRKKKEAIDSDVMGNKIKLSNRLAKKYLSEAKKEIGNKEPFYIALEKALHNFLKAKLNIETSEMSKDKISTLLLSRNAQPETVSAFINLTENCEFARYAPSSSVAIQQDYDKAVTVISELEKQI
ncbi:BatD family protein [Flavobacterium sp. GT3R68]|uniref:BatD family protein n=1 Tax=Flavobacterium sp. GT3R68 TaxID=2594437 RepID=UPI000F85BEAB|nr:BatD family protein [Flavobacterium sp. GT3R68]RTY95818.1 protein BatD [Flavobacterium sp. GSN2]TRW93590.1 protein BatD [Flavobacterium sp. GT3R68]